MSNLKIKLHLGLLDRLSQPMKAVTNGITRFTSQMSASLRRVGTTARQLGGSLNKIGKDFTLKATTFLGGMGGLSLNAAGGIETMQIKFGSLLKSTEKADLMVRDLIDFTAKTPFQLNGVSEAATKLLTAGTLTKDLTGRLSVLGDIATLAGSDLGELGTIYSRVKSAQVAYTMELEMLSDRGVPIWQELSKITGKSVGKIRKETANGLVTFELFEKALESMREEGGVAFQQMEKQGRGWFGLLSTLRDNLNLGFAELGDSAIQRLELKQYVSDLIVWIQGLTESFKKLPDPMQSFIIKGSLMVALIGPLLMGIGQLTLGLGITLIGFSKLFAGMAIFTTFMRASLIPTIILGTKAIFAWSAAFLATPIGLIVAGIAAIAVAGYLIIKHWDKVKIFWGHLWTAITRRVEIAASYIRPIIDSIAQGYNAITDNPLTRGIGDAKSYIFGDGNTGAQSLTAPQGRIDTGGELRIIIDENRRASVSARMNNQNTNIHTDQGILMGGGL